MGAIHEYKNIQQSSALHIFLNMASASTDITDNENQPPLDTISYHTPKSSDASSNGDVPLINASIKTMRPVLHVNDQRTEASFTHNGENSFEYVISFISGYVLLKAKH